MVFPFCFAKNRLVYTRAFRAILKISFETIQNDVTTTTTCQNGDSVSRVFVIMISFGMGFRLFYVETKIYQLNDLINCFQLGKKPWTIIIFRMLF